jgi:hypothetical protein
MGRDETVRLISGTPLFAGLDPSVIELLAGGAVRRSFPKGQTIFREGDVGESLYVVVEGLVKVSVSSADGAELALTTLRPPTRSASSHSSMAARGRRRPLPWSTRPSSPWTGEPCSR